MRRARIDAMTPRMPKWFVTLLLFTGCPPETPATCDVQPVTECPTPAPTFAEVQPLFDTHCNVCHSEPGGEWPLETYDDIASWQFDVRGKLLDCTMPPPEEESSMTLAEKTKILTWVRCGLPR